MDPDVVARWWKARKSDPGGRSQGRVALVAALAGAVAECGAVPLVGLADALSGRMGWAALVCELVEGGAKGAAWADALEAFVLGQPWQRLKEVWQYEVGRRLRRLERLDGASQLLGAAYQKHPAERSNALLWAATALELGRWKTAATVLDAALEEHGDLPGLMALRVRADLVGGTADGARARRLLAVARHVWDRHVAGHALQVAEGAGGEADAVLRQVAAEHEDPYWRGAALARVWEADAALAALAEAAERDPEAAARAWWEPDFQGLREQGQLPPGGLAPVLGPLELADRLGIAAYGVMDDQSGDILGEDAVVVHGHDAEGAERGVKVHYEVLFWEEGDRSGETAEAEARQMGGGRWVWPEPIGGRTLWRVGVALEAHQPSEAPAVDFRGLGGLQDAAWLRSVAQFWWPAAGPALRAAAKRLDLGDPGGARRALGVGPIL